MPEFADMSALDRLIATEEIKNLKARRIRALDTKDWTTYEALHAEDYVADSEDDERCFGTKQNTARLAKLYREVEMVSAHHAHTPEITFQSVSKAKGVWAMEDRLFWKQGDEDHWLHGFGFYHESYEKRDGRWLFTLRQLRRTKVMVSDGCMLGRERP